MATQNTPIHALRRLAAGLAHTSLTEAEMRQLANLPDMFCPCKTCYANCEHKPVNLWNCPPVELQTYAAERVLGFLQTQGAIKAALRADRLTNLASCKRIVARLTAHLYICDEFLRRLLQHGNAHAAMGSSGLASAKLTFKRKEAERELIWQNIDKLSVEEVRFLTMRLQDNASRALKAKMRERVRNKGKRR